MRNFKFLVSLFIGIMALGLKAQEGDKTAATNVPVITFEKTNHDFGTIHEKDVVKTTFTFKNTGNAPLLITRIKASCGCTIPSNWTKEPILPGEESQFTVQFNSRNKPNKQHKRITITCNTAAGREYVNIQANVIPDPELEKARQERYKKIREQQAARKAAQAKKKAAEANPQINKEVVAKEKQEAAAKKKAVKKEIKEVKTVKKETKLDDKQKKAAEKEAKIMAKESVKAKKLSVKIAKLNKQIAKNRAANKKMEAKVRKLENKLESLK